MKLPMRACLRNSVHAPVEPHHQWVPAQHDDEAGQSMLEMTVGLVFLVLIILILFEMAVLFYSYISVLNASREGAIYAATHPNMEVDDSEYQTYRNVTIAEAIAAGLRTESEYFEIHEPEKPYGSDPLDPIIVRVSYQLINPTQGVILPFLGRMGLFQSAWMTASTEMPIQ